ncbi:hypothetical protein [Citricoccus alkalitolerans]|uniref:Type II secretion system F family protein n=1 Tax=Citricoccus alkalitolerans TaxID=246603 RepID=A0ABV8XUV1_9MICC
MRSGPERRSRWWSRWLQWIPGHARRRREHETEEFVALLRRAAALLQAGRRPERVWAELSGLYERCQGGPQELGTPRRPSSRAGCCLHHVLVSADLENMLGGEPFAAVEALGQGRHWRQLDGCLAVSHHAGIPLAGLLERLADALEEGQDAQQARDAAAAGPRSTAQLLGFLPLAGIAMTALVGGPPTELLAGTLGWLVIGTGVGLAVIGHLWTRALIRRSEETT